MVVCNTQAVDILSVVRSFCQGGSVYSVTIYPSEYGKKRMVRRRFPLFFQAEEEKYGPEGRIVDAQADFAEDASDAEDDEEKINEDRRREVSELKMRASKVRAGPSSLLFRGDRLRQQVHGAVDLRPNRWHGIHGGLIGGKSVNRSVLGA